MQTRTKHELIVIAFSVALVLAFMAFAVMKKGAVQRSVLNAAIFNEIRQATDEYRKAYGSLPDTLDNHELVEILCRGANLRKITFLPSRDGSVFDLMLNSSHDAFIDIWGHELRFLSGADGKIIVWSAGPNGIFEDRSDSDDIRSE